MLLWNAFREHNNFPKVGMKRERRGKRKEREGKDRNDI
jgi:hypothetical protein